MTAQIIPFITLDAKRERDIREFATWQQSEDVTGLELFKLLYESTLECLDILIKLYKKTGHWNPVAEKLFTRVHDDTKAICVSLAGAEEENGKTKGKQKQAKGKNISVVDFKPNGDGPSHTG